MGYDGSLFIYHSCAKVDHFYFIKLMGDWLSKIGATDALTCPFCGVGKLSLGREFAPLLGFRLWLLILLGLPALGKQET